eukprot:TRINITY_DN47722_c0_g1_i1.p1 TRINITY_DN47722_c0_g1~~TRINITY_DN47722_c0_g1_i1.p1  ORF type:complete len:331 (-),score=69.18 TRINITY_DN47722_c0_g1_i1:149-1141(-)
MDPAGSHLPQLEELQRIRRVGRGARSEVWLVQQESSGSFFALKETPRASIKWKQEADHLWNERDVLMEISRDASQFPRCCKLFSALKDDTAIYFLLDFIPGAPLHHHFQACGGFEESRARFYCCELVATLGALHGLAVVYRDLKASNVMIDARDGHLKLVDFGFAKKLSQQPKEEQQPQQLRTTSVCGTDHAMAPEIWCLKDLGPEEREAKGYTLAVDWWSLGILTFEMLTARPPFGYQDGDRTIQELAFSSPASVQYPSNFGSALRDFLSGLLQAAPEVRLGSAGAKEVEAHPWLEWHAVASGGVPDFDNCLGEFPDSWRGELDVDDLD